MNIPAMFQAIRSIPRIKALTQVQVDSINALLESCKKHGVVMVEQIAYILATVCHESEFKPIEEGGKGAGRDYGKKLDMGGGPGKRVPYTVPNKLFYGRGLVQITWLCNYRAFAKLLGIDLVNRPELALQTDVAAEIAVIGMQKGMFTGKSLTTYFNTKSEDPENARKIINSLDCADLIKGYYEVILRGLNS